MNHSKRYLLYVKVRAANNVHKIDVTYLNACRDVTMIKPSTQNQFFQKILVNCNPQAKFGVP